MAPTNYDQIAPSYDQRYERTRYPGIDACLAQFVGPAKRRVLEVGCGSGHWLAALAAAGHEVAGVDPSSGMLARARASVPGAQLVRGHAEALPFAADSFERVVIINALHHFVDAPKALSEIARVLVRDGAVLIIGLDPSAGQDSWCIYDYFPGTLEHDRARYPATTDIRAWLHERGFERCHSYVAERIDNTLDARDALTSGALGRHSTSQLTDLSDEAYAAGLTAIETAASAADSRGERCLLRAHLRLFATEAVLR